VVAGRVDNIKQSSLTHEAARDLRLGDFSLSANTVVFNLPDKNWVKAFYGGSVTVVSNEACPLGGIVDALKGSVITAEVVGEKYLTWFFLGVRELWNDVISHGFSCVKKNYTEHLYKFVGEMSI
jgi:hypothetical protein